jgi:hypothetical protein
VCGVVRGDIDTRADAVNDRSAGKNHGGIKYAHRQSAYAKPVGSVTD